MSRAQLFIDVDAVAKLAHWNVLPLLPQILGVPWSAMAAVPSLIHRTHRAVTTPDGKLFRTSAAAATAKAALEQMTDPGVPDSTLLESLSAFPDIDPGEAILLALTAQTEGAALLTGDKRALRRLSKTPLAKKFSERIVVIEQVLQSTLKLKGRDWFLANVCPSREIDKAIAISLGSDCTVSQSNLEAGLASYIGEMEALANPSLVRLLPQTSG